MSKKISASAVIVSTGLVSLLAALPLSSALAQSKDDLSRVEVSGQKLQPVTRFDVSKACPDVAKSLQESLARVAYLEGSAGVVKVSFQLTGEQIDTIKASDGPFEYRRATRRAMYDVACKDGSGQPQRFSFIVSFNNPHLSGDTGQRVALLSPEQAATLD